MPSQTDLITRKQVAELFGVCSGYIPALTLKNICPAPLKIGPRSVVYLRQQVEPAAAAYRTTKQPSQPTATGE